MKNVASADQELSVEERNLLSVAYKNVIGARRASWRIVTSIEQKEESKGNEGQAKLIKEYRQKIEAELAGICRDILEVLDKHLIQSAKTGESKVFYHKMCATPDLSVTRGIELLIPITGRATITVISPNLRLATNARILPISRWKLTRRPPRSLRPILLLLILSASDLPSTSRSSTMRSSVPPIKPAISPNKRLMTQLLVCPTLTGLMASPNTLTRTRHTQRRELQGLHAHHAAPQR